MMKPHRLILLAAVPLLALAGCKKATDQPKAAAGGELLPRSASDDMLPYDTVRSQASLSPPDDAVDALDMPDTAAPRPTGSQAAPEPVTAPAEPAPLVDAPAPAAQQP